MVYKYCVNDNLIFSTKINVGEFENEFLKLDGNKIIIYGKNLKGYSWDGCSPTIEFLDIYLGTPDGVIRKTKFQRLKTFLPLETFYKYVPKTYIASLIHDILYQYLLNHGLSREKCDFILLEFLKKSDFKLAYLYFVIVRVTGGVRNYWKKLLKKILKLAGSKKKS